MEKRVIVIILLVVSATLSASPLFPGIDFTFFKSTEDTLAVLNNERFGFDYSGFGYVGSDMTTGLYIRFGVQMPYSIFSAKASGAEESIKSPADSTQTVTQNTTTTETTETLNTTLTLESDVKDESKEDGNKESNKNKNLDYKFAFAIGPAFRKFIGDQAQWYLGLGFTSEIEVMNSSTDIAITSKLNVKIGAEYDMGFRIDTRKKNTSLRIGIHGKTGLLTFSSLSSTSKDSTTTEMSLIADIFRTLGEKSSSDTIGYVSLGHTFQSGRREQHYSYSTKSREINKGITKEI